nr:FadR/GntR family transcriptional regulator [uncultured Desulfobacter sp.]
MEKKIGSQIQEEIIKMIEDGSVKQGQRLPAERVLSMRFGVSRNTVREAIRALAEQGIVRSLRGSGSYVESDAAQRIKNRVRAALEGRQLRVMEIFEIRRMLEPAVAAKVAGIKDPGALDTLSQILDGQIRAQENDQDGAAFDKAFHTALVKAAGNSVLEIVYATLGNIMAESRIPDLQSPERADLSIAAHKRVLDCLGSADADGAAQAMARHMDEIETILKQKIGEDLR